MLRLGQRFGWLARPRADRWHRRPTALFGGVAIFVAFVGVTLAFVPLDREVIGLLLGTAVVFGVGLIDDIVAIKPYTKLIAQIAAACVLVSFGIHVGFVVHPLVAIPVTVLWVVGITNAFNLLDNMDGLASGVAIITALFFYAFTGLGDTDSNGTALRILTLALAGAASGFLIFNFNPARIFMGDCGSMTLGFVLAAASIMGTWQQAGNLSLIMSVPVLVLAVPIFDTALVTVIRTLSGRKVSQGGRDHSSHRLVALGLTERRAVVVLWGLCLAFGGVALLGYWVNLYVAAVTAGLLLVGSFFFGVFLGQVPIYHDVDEAALGEKRPALINTLLLHKRRIVEVAIDFVLVCLAYIAAYLLRFEGVLEEPNLRLIYQSLPIIIVIKMTAFYVFGLYRGVWRYVGMTDALNIVKAVAAGSLVSALALVLIYRFEGYSRSVLVLDGLLLLFFLAGVRALLRVFRETFRSRATGRNVLIAGAGDGGEMLLREIRAAEDLDYHVVGFIDDDREKHGRRLHGTPVLGSREDLKALVRRHGVEEVLIAIPRATGEEMHALVEACKSAGVPCRTSPRLSELIDGTVKLGEVRDVDVRDLLGRAPMRHDSDLVRSAVGDRVVLITGAAGTIGREVALRAHAYGARKLVLVDQDENGLAALSGSLPDAVRVLLDVSREDATRALLEEHRPALVIHAAVASQASVLDENPGGAVLTNVLAVRSIVRAADGIAEQFLLVSTSKAFEPSNLAVATRRLGEDVARTSAEHTPVTVLRLPNVLEAKGGVLQVFRAQASEGRPLTVTDEQVTRRFLTVAEAAGLIIEAATLDVPRESSILIPTGLAPLPIVDIARAVLRESDRGDQDLVFVGLRAGESEAEPWPAKVESLDHRCWGHVAVEALAPDDVDALLERLERGVARHDGSDLRAAIAQALDADDLATADATVIELKRR